MNFNLFPVFTEHDKKLPVFLTSLGGWVHQSAMERKDGYADFQWLQATSGKGCLQLEDRKMTVSAGQGMLLLPHEAHAYWPLEEPWGMRWVTFSGARLAELLENLGMLRTEVLSLSDPDVTFKHLQELYTLLKAPHPSTAMETSGVLYRLLMDLYRYGSASELRSRTHHMDALAPVLRYMEAHYARPITLAELAGLLGVSNQHVCVLFQQGLGVRPIEYLTRIRIRKAKELLLVEPGAEVKTIGAQVGYEDTSYFIKLFKRQEGLTPSLFRRAHLHRL